MFPVGNDRSRGWKNLWKYRKKGVFNTNDVLKVLINLLGMYFYSCILTLILLHGWNRLRCSRFCHLWSTHYNNLNFIRNRSISTRRTLFSTLICRNMFFFSILNIVKYNECKISVYTIYITQFLLHNNYNHSRRNKMQKKYTYDLSNFDV